MATILVAASADVTGILRRILVDHDLICAQTLLEAERLLGEARVDLIVCTVLFDESRMFDFLRIAKAKREWRDIPFICARLRREVIDTPVALEGVAFSCRTLGAVAFLDVQDYSVELEMGAAIERFLPG